MKKRLLSTFLVLAMMLSIIPALTMEANAAESSSVVSGELKQYISAISTSSGTTRLSVDNLRGNLNRKSSKAADYWLYADFTSNADEAITGIWIMRSNSLTTIDGYVVTRASVNVNSEGRACYIYYTKDKNAGAPIASVGVWQSEDDYFEYVTNVGTELQEYYNTSFNNQYSNYGYTIVGGDDTDLNADAGSKTAYVYLYYKRAPYVKTQNASFCYDGQPHNGSVTVSDGAVVTYGTGVSAIGSHTQTFKVTKDGMLPISGTTQVVITDHDYSVSLNNKVSASCKAAGHETDMKCSKCGAVKAGAVIPKLDHTYKNVICTVCGALEEGYTRIKTSSAYYKIDGDTIYIDGKGEIPNNAFKQKLSDSINLVAVTKAVIGDSITGIGMSAFYACKSLTSVTIPNSVKSIGPSAFCGCSVLTSVTIPNSVTSIGGNAFAACSNLTSVTIPNSVTSIGEGAFLQCSKLTSITIPGSVKSPAANIFSKCTSLKTVVIENGVTSISDYMFNSCSALTSVTIPDTVTSIGAQAFYGTNLTSVTIPNSVTSLASNAFNGTKLLKQATLPCRLNYSFANGVRVTKVHVGDAVTDASKAPTCTENGLTEGTHCSVCGAVLTAQEVITASGHIWGSWNVWQEPSCTEPGIRGRICERCHTEETEEIPMTDHYWGSWNVWEEPSCTSTGTRGRFCERCYATDTEEIPMTDHYWGSWNVWQEPTCTTAGIRGRTCQRCYQSEQEPIDTLSHEWQDGYCTICGERIKLSGISVINGAQLTDDGKMIYGLTCGLNSAKDYFEITDNSLSLSNGKAVIGTGTHINVLKDGEIATYYEAVIFGDVNGDGWYDGMDAMIVSCLANGMLTQDDVSEAVYMAADCNHDGVIDRLDVDILNQAGVLLSQVDQSKSEEELLETSSAYVECLNLINQNVTDGDTTNAPIEEPSNNKPTDNITNVFAWLIDFLVKAFNYFKLHFAILK